MTPALLESIDQSVGFAMHRTVQAIKSRLRGELRAAGHDITPEQWAVLFALHRGGKSLQRDLARRTAKDQPTMTRLLDGLVRLGLVARSPGPDRRSQFVDLTSEGSRTTELLIPVVSRVHNTLLDGFEPAERQQLFQFLDKIAENAEHF